MRPTPSPAARPSLPTPAPAAMGQMLAALAVMALLYTIGWSYAANFYGHFQVGLAALNLPHSYYFAYAYYAVKVLWWVLLLFAAFIAVDIFFLWWLGFATWYGNQSPVRRQALLWVTVLLFIALGGKFGEIAARQAFESGVVNGFPEMPAVRVTLRDDKVPPGVAKGLQAGCYRLLAHTAQPERLFVLRVNPRVSGFAVEVVGEESVALLRLLSQPPVCDDNL